MIFSVPGNVVDRSSRCGRRETAPGRRVGQELEVSARSAAHLSAPGPGISGPAKLDAELWRLSGEGDESGRKVKLARTTLA